MTYFVNLVQNNFDAVIEEFKPRIPTKRLITYLEVLKYLDGFQEPFINIELKHRDQILAKCLKNIDKLYDQQTIHDLKKLKVSIIKDKYVNYLDSNLYSMLHLSKVELLDKDKILMEERVKNCVGLSDKVKVFFEKLLMDYSKIRMSFYGNYDKVGGWRNTHEVRMGPLKSIGRCEQILEHLHESSVEHNQLYYNSILDIIRLSFILNNEKEFKDLIAYFIEKTKDNDIMFFAGASNEFANIGECVADDHKLDYHEVKLYFKLKLFESDENSDTFQYEFVEVRLIQREYMSNIKMNYLSKYIRHADLKGCRQQFIDSHKHVTDFLETNYNSSFDIDVKSEEIICNNKLYLDTYILEKLLVKNGKYANLINPINISEINYKNLNNISIKYIKWKNDIYYYIKGYENINANLMEFLAKIETQSFYIDAEMNRILIGTRNEGLYIVDYNSLKVKNHLMNENCGIYCIKTDVSDNKIYITTYYSGFYVYKYRNENYSADNENDTFDLQLVGKYYSEFNSMFDLFICHKYLFAVMEKNQILRILKAEIGDYSFVPFHFKGKAAMTLDTKYNRVLVYSNGIQAYDVDSLDLQKEVFLESAIVKLYTDYESDRLFANTEFQGITILNLKTLEIAYSFLQYEKNLYLNSIILEPSCNRIYICSKNYGLLIYNYHCVERQSNILNSTRNITNVIPDLHKNRLFVTTLSEGVKVINRSDLHSCNRFLI